MAAFELPMSAEASVPPASQGIIQSLHEKGTPDTEFKVSEVDVDIVLDAEAYVSGPAVK